MLVKIYRGPTLSFYILQINKKMLISTCFRTVFSFQLTRPLSFFDQNCKVLAYHLSTLKCRLFKILNLKKIRFFKIFKISKSGQSYKQETSYVNISSFVACTTTHRRDLARFLYDFIQNMSTLS